MQSLAFSPFRVFAPSSSKQEAGRWLFDYVVTCGSTLANLRDLIEKRGVTQESERFR
jgi:hypothetical protein